MDSCTKTVIRFFISIGLICWSQSIDAQLPVDSVDYKASQSIGTDIQHLGAKRDLDVEMTDEAMMKMALTDSTTTEPKRDWNTWRPTPKRALWLALVLPGAGQIYNRKFWKLPIIYGGFVGCAYAMRWNNMMYRDYSQAYLDIMDNDPNTQSYNQFLHLGNTVTAENMQRYQDIFKKRKDRYRRWRDMSFFVLVGVYAISVVDAYVDASLSEFDISPDLSLHIQPAFMNNGLDRNPFRSSALGMQCSLNF